MLHQVKLCHKSKILNGTLKSKLWLFTCSSVFSGCVLSSSTALPLSLWSQLQPTTGPPIQWLRETVMLDLDSHTALFILVPSLLDLSSLLLLDSSESPSCTLLNKLRRAQEITKLSKLSSNALNAFLPASKKFATTSMIPLMPTKLLLETHSAHQPGALSCSSSDTCSSSPSPK